MSKLHEDFAMGRSEHGLFPDGYNERKAIPVWTGVVDYFAAALVEIARVSQAGNDQHNPGQPLHWSRGKSTNQLDTAMRHAMERRSGVKFDTDGTRHLAKACWRMLAELQLECEADGYPVAPGARIEPPAA